MLNIQSHLLHHLENALPAFFLIRFQIVHNQPFFNELTAGHAGVQGRIGVLEYNLNVLVAIFPFFLGVQIFQVLPLIDNIAARYRMKSDNTTPQGRFAATGFADYT